jgi:hypothetical protein
MVVVFEASLEKGVHDGASWRGSVCGRCRLIYAVIRLSFKPGGTSYVGDRLLKR